MTLDSQLRKTPLFDRHVDLGGKIVDFGGYALPIQYTSIMEEHLNVRSQAGIFDVSHLGEIRVSGREAFDFLQRMVPTDFSELKDHFIQYTLVLNAQGGVMDDILIYKQDQENYYLVVNAGNIDKIFQHLKSHAPESVDVVNDSERCACIAIQGPKALGICDAVMGGDPGDLKYYEYKALEGYGDKVWISRSGYTGEDGFEYFAPPEIIGELWDKFMKEGLALGLKPAGLGSRNTLRLEVGNSLYGHEMNEDTLPHEARLGWLVSKTKNYFGKEALEKRREQGLQSKICGFKMLEKSIARDGYKIWKDNECMGHVASGSFSPSLNANIGLASVKPEFAVKNTEFEIQVHGKRVPARVVALPFVPIRHL